MLSWKHYVWMLWCLAGYERQVKVCMMGPTDRTSIKPGVRVAIILKADQSSGKLTEGVVKDILTNSPAHPHGIKVRLQSGQIGRVKELR